MSRTVLGALRDRPRGVRPSYLRSQSVSRGGQSPHVIWMRRRPTLRSLSVHCRVLRYSEGEVMTRFGKRQVRLRLLLACFSAVAMATALSGCPDIVAACTEGTTEPCTCGPVVGFRTCIDRTFNTSCSCDLDASEVAIDASGETSEEIVEPDVKTDASDATGDTGDTPGDADDDGDAGDAANDTDDGDVADATETTTDADEEVGDISIETDGSTDVADSSVDGVSCVPGNPCDDIDPCTLGDYCNASSVCVGTVIACNDGNPCTLDECDEATGECLTDAQPGIPCDDGEACTDDDACTAAATCLGIDKLCDDGKLCTEDSCSGGQCVFNTENCDCLTAQDCDDSNPCTTNTCDLATGDCELAANISTPCDDGDLCTQTDACNATGECVGLLIACDDGNDCTDDLCVAGTCEFAPNSANPCDDGVACTVSDVCVGATCQGVPLVCNDGLACTNDGCNPGTGACDYVPMPGPCDDSDPCTIGDMCNGSQCVGNQVDCNDDNICTNDFCDGTGTCVHNPMPGATCDDGDDCTFADECDAVANCVGQGVNCNDNQACTMDFCEFGACQHLPMDSQCDDGIACTIDICNPGSGCDNLQLPDGNSCNDGQFCFPNAQCFKGECVNKYPACADGNPCTLDVCNEVEQQCDFVPQPNQGVAQFEEFDNQCAEIPGVLDSPWGSLTIEFFYFPFSNGQSQGKWIIDKEYGSASSNNSDPSFRINHQSCCDVEFNSPASGGGVTGNIGGNYQWYHIALVIDDEANEVRMYVNGQQDGSNFGVPPFDSVPTFVGCAYNEIFGGLDRHMDGLIDELHISSVARYQPFQDFEPQVNPVVDQHTRALYRFENYDWQDSSGNGYDGFPAPGSNGLNFTFPPAELNCN